MINKLLGINITMTQVNVINRIRLNNKCNNTLGYKKSNVGAEMLF